MSSSALAGSQSEFSSPIAPHERSTRHKNLLAAGLFSLTSFVGAALLFTVQPMVAKLILPLFGGTPSVWNTANLFFQTSLLAGYVTTHLLIRRLGVRRQSLLQIGLVVLPVLALPIGLPGGAEPPTAVAPALWLLYVLALTVGAPFVLLSTTGPLLQRWFAATAHPRRRDPYFLFAAGNTGSLLALLSYPAVIEPRLTLAQQLRTWSLGYLLFVALVVACAAALRWQPEGTASPSSAPIPDPEPVPPRRRLRWIGLAALPSSLMLGTTTFVTTDLAPVPLLWVVPLALYLISFIVAFALSRSAAARLSTRLARLLPALVLITAAGVVRLPTAWHVALSLLLFTVVATAAHAKLAADRPEVENLTSFFVFVAVGGAAGGAVNGLLAPVVLNQFYEYPVAIAVGLLLLPRRAQRAWLERRYGVLGTILLSLLVLVVLLALRAVSTRHAVASLAGWGAVLLAALAVLAVIGVRRPRPFAAGVALMLLLPLLWGGAALTTRTFFGVQQVTRTADGLHVLRNGSTVHGWQDTRPGRTSEPQSYYHRDGPAGQALSALPASTTSQMGVVGLGTGSLAAYGQAGQKITFFEIDRATVDIARDPQYFTYLRDSRAGVTVTLGDGRLSLQRVPTQTYDVLVLDAFSSDAIPIHLLTAEAVRLYLSKITQDGLLLFHISNRHVDLAPVLANIAAERGAFGLIQQDRSNDARTGKLASTWVVVGKRRASLDRVAASGAWTALELSRSGSEVWTDDFSNVLSVLK